MTKKVYDLLGAFLESSETGQFYLHLERARDCDKVELRILNRETKQYWIVNIEAEYFENV